MATRKKKAKKKDAYALGYEAAIESITSVPIEQYCLRLELAWKRCPTMNLGELLTRAQAHALASQYDLSNTDYIEAVERFAGVRK